MLDFKLIPTPYAEDNENNVNLYNALSELSDGADYKTTPQKIGTWIDGNPIYRKAFDVLLKDMEAVSYDDMLSNQAFTVGMISDSGSAYLINAFCAYADENGTLYHCGIDALTDTAVDFAIPDGVTIPEDQSDCTTERYYGYIDYIQN